MPLLYFRHLAVSALCCGLLSASHAPVFAAPREKAKVAAAKTKPLQRPLTLGQGRVLEPGIVWNEVSLKSAAGFMRLWIYRPAEAQIAGDKKFPVVFVAPAGTPLHYGSRVGPGSSPEHIPYVRAGFIVVAYEIDGDVAQSGDMNQVEVGTRQFIRANSGLNNGMTAVNFALARIPRVDPKRLYVAGHSSAGTLALQMAEYDRRIAACVAYAPCTDIATRLDAEYIQNWESRIPGFTRTVIGFSPNMHPEKLRCPTFLFHADDDSNVPLADNYAFAVAVRRTNPRLYLARVATGNHYESMIQQGIPWAIRWLQTKPETIPATKTKSKTTKVTASIKRKSKTP